MKTIYLDYAATTPIDDRVAKKMLACLTKEGNFGNPSSLHVYGQQARHAIEEAREQVAGLLNAEVSEIIWTSGATEAVNLAIKGSARIQSSKGKHIVTLKSEHKAVLDSCQYLEKEGYAVTYLSLESNGKLDLEKLINALKKETFLVSIMMVNNETGIYQDIETIANITSERGILLHVDAAQSVGKLPIDLKQIPIDLLSTCAHKVYGPKGIGALYLRKKPRVRVHPLIHGGGHEQGMRSGTLPTHQIVGMGEAFDLAKIEMEKDTKKIKSFRDLFITQICSIPSLRINTDIRHAVPHILNISFENTLNEAILKQLPALAISSGSACLGTSGEGSYVLRAMGATSAIAKSALRISFGRMTTEADVAQAAQMIKGIF